MRLSLILELLLIFVLLAFAASAVVDFKRPHGRKKHLKRTHGKEGQKVRQDATSANKYCSCSAKLCNCCREFNIPVVSLQGPGCASLQYLKGDRLAISMSFGERVLSNTTISSKKPKPICMPLPGGVSKFCGRVYNIGRRGQDFNACLGLELRALQDVEASLRVACFRFGAEGLRVEPSQPLPVVNEEFDDDEDDDDDDDTDDDDDDDDDEDDEAGFFDAEEDEDSNDVDSEDYSAFSVFGDDILGSFLSGESYTEKPVKRKTAKPPLKVATRKPVRSTPKPKRQPKPTTSKVTIDKAGTSVNNVRPIDANTPSSPHESIAAVTGVLQDSAGGGEPPVASVGVKPPRPAPIRISAPLIETSAGLGSVDTSVNMTEPSISSSSLETPIENSRDPTTENVTVDTTEVTEVTEPATEQAVTENQTSKNSDKKNKKPEESNDVFDEIIDGVVETIAGSEEATEKKNGTLSAASSEEEDDEDEDDEDEDDDDDEKDGNDDDDDDDLVDDDIDDDDEDDGEERSVGRKHRGRQSRDMWLERLHW